MALSLILHDLSGLAPDDKKQFFESIFQIAPEHWPMDSGTTLAETGVTPAYLRHHLLATVPPAQRDGLRLLITRVSADAAWNAQPADGDAWLKAALDEG